MPPPSPLAAARSLPGDDAPPSAPSLGGLLAERLASGGHEPFLTFYDDASGERTELSYATLDNWVAKTANLLVEELELEAGDRVVTALGTHWTGLVVAFACWRAGCCLVPADRHPEMFGYPAGAAFVREGGERLQGHRPLVVVGRGLGGRLAEPTADLGDALPYAEEVLAFGDEFEAPAVTANDDALVVPSVRGGAAARLDQGNLLAAAEVMPAWGLAADDRLLCARNLHELDALVLGHLGALVAGASVVLTAGADTGWRKTADERCTTALVGPSDLADLSGDRPSGLRALLVPAGAPAAAAAAARARVGVPVAVGHGLPDATGAAALEPADVGAPTRAWIDAAPGRPAGTPTPRAAVTALDEDAEPLPDGEEGRLAVRGPVVLAAYEGPPVTLDENALARGWLVTGERGVVTTGPDGASYVFVTRERVAT